MTGLRVRKKEQARARIVATAAQLFEQHGIDATSIEDIAEASDVSRATVFNYFPYKEAILVEIGAQLVADIAHETAEHRRRSVRHALLDLADAVASVAERHEGIVAYIAREMTHPDPGRRAYAAERMGYPRLYEALLSELAKAGRLRSPDRLRSHGRQLVDLTTGALVRVGNDFPIGDLRAELRANVEVFWEGAVSPEA
jgi:AcrR family transcriptional regulator